MMLNLADCRHAILALFVCCLLAPTDLVRAEEPIRVMSFNIRFGTARDGDNHWRLRKEVVASTVQNFNPDLLGTQETLLAQAKFLNEKLKGYARVGKSRETNPKSGEQCTIFFREERFDLLKTGQFWLSETPEKVASKSWDSSLPRIATWVKLRDIANDDREFIFLNTHFDHRGRVARLEAAKLIASRIAKFKLPCIVTGDFNTPENSEPYKALVKSEKIKLVDTYRQQHPERGKNEGTFNGFTGKDTGARIDWVLHTPQFKTSSAKIDKSNSDGRYPSDHFPVTAILQFQ